MENIISTNIESSRADYWSVISLYIFNQHLVNRRLSGTKCEFLLPVSNYRDLTFDCNNKIEPEIIDNIDNLEIKDSIDKESFEEICAHDSYEHNSKFIGKFKLIPRNCSVFNCAFVYVFIDLEKNSTYLHHVQLTEKSPLSVDFDICIQYCDNSLILKVPVSITTSCSVNWVTNTLNPKLLKWIENNHVSSQNPSIKSLSLVCIEEYSKLYNELKEKYGRELIKNWSESTDPMKFVYEDISIATYLILLWREERRSNNLTDLQSFVDLGCGNGLLVYLLKMEGHPGYGIDLRERKIWKSYPPEVLLKIEAITPSNTSIFPEIDWIIGNHSDELSPWIPVIAARSSYKCKYFLLPCCAYQFDGSKYQRRNIQKSQYHDFIDYTKEISNVCGFTTKIDRLKIPSTKRIALVGFNRNYPESEYPTQLENIQNFINHNSKVIFKPRDSIEKVRNCTKIDKNLTNEIIQTVFDKILTKRKICDEIPGWNIGGSLSLSEVVNLISKEKLIKLKSECGGIQTLLKNHNQIFQVIKGTVNIRMPVKLSEKLKEDQKNSKNYEYKRKECWFHNHHPDGCPFNNDECSFKHDDDD